MTYTWTDNAMQSGTPCNVDTVNSNLMYLKNSISNISMNQPAYVPYSVNSGAVDTNGYASFISKVDNATVKIAAATTPIVLTYPDGSQETISADQTIGGLANGTYAIVKEKGNNTLIAVNTAQYGKDLFINFNDGTPNDVYGLNKVYTIGNPTFSNNKFNSNGTTGIDIPIYTLGTGSWCVQEKFCSTNTTSQTLFELANSADTVALMGLYKNTSNKLVVNLSSNGTSQDIANGIVGTKSDWSTSIEYYVRLYFTGTQYKVDWSLDGISWTNDITINSTSIIFQTTTYPLVFGLNIANNMPLVGTTSVLQVTVGNSICVKKNVASEGMILPAFSMDGDYFLNIGVKPYQPYKKVSGAWVSTQFVKLGEVTILNGTMGTPISYAFNGKYISPDVACTGVSTVTTFNHNLGTNNIKPTQLQLRNYVAEWGYSACDVVIPISIDFVPSTYVTMNFAPRTQRNFVSFVTSNAIPYMVEATNGTRQTLTASSWKQCVVCERSF